MHLNFEFKARAADLLFLEQKLSLLNPVFSGEDEQTDTYFNVPNGRLKLREGNIENALIQYNRSNEKGAKTSNVILYQCTRSTGLKQALIAALGVKTIVHKVRKIYFVENVKIHFDAVAALGTFVEVEAIDSNGLIGIDKLNLQCAFFADLFGITPADYVAESYSDLLLA